MTYAMGAVSKVLVGNSTANLSAVAASGGTGPYTYQLYRSTTNGFTPGAGNIVAGQTGLSYADSGLAAGTTYYYVVQSTDTGAGNATANSAQLTVVTQPSVSQNQFAQGPIVGLVDLKVGPTNVMAAQIDASVVGSVLPGTAMKIVSNINGGVPKVAPISSKSDQVIGFLSFNVKDLNYSSGQNCEIAMWGSVIWLYATGTVAPFAEVCLDPTYVGGVQATGATATWVGQSLDGVTGGGLIRVQLMPNVSFATA